MRPNFPSRPSALVHLAAAAAATAATLCIGAALLGAFHASSPQQWLTASPEVLADLARCDDRPGRASRERCRQQVALQRLEPTAVRLAAGDQKPNATLRGRP